MKYEEIEGTREIILGEILQHVFEFSNMAYYILIERR
jgi:hypothetical protein